jgi:hypothetical protein
MLIFLLDKMYKYENGVAFRLAFSLVEAFESTCTATVMYQGYYSSSNIYLTRKQKSAGIPPDCEP